MSGPITRLLAFLIAGLVPFVASAQTVQDKELVAVLDLSAVEASDAEAAALTNRMRELLLKSGRVTLVDRSQMKAVLDEQALQQTGCTTQECAVQVGRVLGVRKIVAGEVIKVSDEVWLVSALMVDVETAETLRLESLRHRGDFFALMDEGVKRLVQKFIAGTGRDGDRAAPAAMLSSASIPSKSPPLRTEHMVSVAAGEFQMGEGATRTVYLDAFLIDEAEVTQKAYLDQTGLNPGKPAGANLPVNNVDWGEAERYCAKLSKRLPTSAEWEKAARAGTRSKFFYGDHAYRIVRYGNGCGEGCWDPYIRNNTPEPDGFKGLAPVRSFEPNDWGMYDVYGNVAEWVADWDSPFPSTVRRNPRGPANGQEKIVRGGSFRTLAAGISSALSEAYPPDTKSESVGFRCAADAP